MILTEHFRLEEFLRSETADRRGISNVPEMDAINNLRALCVEVLEPLREMAGPIAVTSGYRCLALNRAIGSKDTSQHVSGRAADIVSPILTEDRLFELAMTLRHYDQLIREYPPGGWVHVSYVGGGPNRKQNLLIDASGTRPWARSA